MSIFDAAEYPAFRIEETADVIRVVWGNQVMIDLPPDDAGQIIPGLTEAYLNSKGWETLEIHIADIQHGDRLPALNIIVDYCLCFGNHSYELGVWSDGRCVLVFRDPELKIKVERQIQ